MGTFFDREQKLNDQSDAALENAWALKSGLRSLFDKYRTTLDGIEENLPRALHPANPVLGEQMLIGELALKEASALMDQADQFEKDAVRERLQRAEGGLMAEQERMALVLSSYKRNLEKAEGRLAESRREAADLAVQIRQLVANGGRGGGGGLDSAASAVDQQELLRAMKEQFAQQIQSLQGMQRPGTREKPASPMQPKPGTARQPTPAFAPPPAIAEVDAATA